MLSLFMFLFLIFISPSTESEDQYNANLNFVKTEIIEIYDSLLAGKVTDELLLNYENYLDSPNRYWDFLDETFLDNWDFDATTKALIGNEIFHSLSQEEFITLSKTLQMTLIRYAFESLPFYSEQRLSVIDIIVNKKQTFAWLKINIESPRLPNIHLDLLLIRNEKNRWKGVDFRFKGITYVNLKKNGHREDFKRLKFRGLLRKLNEKNKVFFKELCNGEANYLDPEKLPCL